MSIKVGVIGLGSMGGTLARCLLVTGTVPEKDLMVTNRSPEKISILQSSYSGIVACPSNKVLTEQADLVFICVRTPQVPEVLFDIADTLRPEQHIVIINGGVQLKHVAGIFQGAVSKAIPSMTMGSGNGVTLLCHHDRVSETQRNILEGMLSKLCPVRSIKEGQFEVAADLTSCAPAFVAEFVKKFAEAGCRHSDLGEREARGMVLSMLLGTSMLLVDERMTIEDLQRCVATKGGITEQGLMVLDEYLPTMFDQLFQATLSKHEMVKAQTAAKFESAE